MGADLDLHPDRLRGVTNGLAAVAGAVTELTRHLRQCTATAAHFGAPDAGGRLGAGFVAGHADVLAALARAGHVAATLADELRTSGQAVADADQHSAQSLRAAGAGMDQVRG